MSERERISPITVAESEETTHKERMQALKEEQKTKVREKQINRGVIIVNTGDGKGKSTSAFGLALRTAGNGLSVGLVQFIKGKWKTGEKKAFERFPEIEHVVSGEGFTWNTQDQARDIEAANRGWKIVCEMIEASRTDPSKYHLLILDELNIALRYKHLNLKEVILVLKNKPPNLNIAITGRDAPPELVEVADTVTEMKPVKHAFDAGIKAQRGIEF